MDSLVTYRLDDGIATIAMDDGKRNALSPRMLRALDAAFDRAEADRAVVVLTGREGVFSAGFDLHVLRAAGLDTLGMVHAGFELAARILAFPTPVVVACNGHAMAMGAFLLLSGDYRIGTRGAFKLTANEVAIGITVPRAGVEICRQRLAPAHFQRAVVLAEVYGPEASLEAGFVDRVVEADELATEADAVARELAKLDMRAHVRTKLRARDETLRILRRVIKTDVVDLTVEGARRFVGAKVKAGARPIRRGT